jgi:hypothetical protein
MAGCKAAKTALFMACLLLATPIAAAPLEQSDCVYDGMSSAQIVSVMQGVIKQAKEGENEEEIIRRKLTPSVNRCATKFGWNETDKENAYRFTFADVMLRLMNAILESEGVDTKAIYAFYKKEPLTVAEMFTLLDDQAYRDDLEQRLLLAELVGKDGEWLDLGISSISFLVITDLLIRDFTDGVLRE